MSLRLHTSSPHYRTNCLDIYPTRGTLCLFHKGRGRGDSSLTTHHIPFISLSPPSAKECLDRCLVAPALPSSPLPLVPQPIWVDIPEPSYHPYEVMSDAPTSKTFRSEVGGYGIRDVWVEAVVEVAPTNLAGLNARQFHYETARLLDQEALVSREAWAHSVGLSSAVHYETFKQYWTIPRCRLPYRLTGVTDDDIDCTGFITTGIVVSGIGTDSGTSG
ncbi:hypothetical protein Tco_0474516 [Tanacetum coccineum]